MKTNKPKTNRQMSLYRAKLNCKIARDAIEGTLRNPIPQGVSPSEYALFCISHAIEEIADAMWGKSKWL